MRPLFVLWVAEWMLLGLWAKYTDRGRRVAARLDKAGRGLAKHLLGGDHRDEIL